MWYVKFSDGSLAILANMRHNLSINAVKVKGAEEDALQSRATTYLHWDRDLGCMQSHDFLLALCFSGLT